MRYVVIRTVERTTVVIGTSHKEEEAFHIMETDFMSYFLQAYGNCDPKDEDNSDKYELNTDCAYANGIHGYDYDWNIIDTKCNDVIQAPLTQAEMRKKRDKDNYVEANILMDLSEFTDNDFETVLDIISTRLVGSPLLMGINYDVIDALPDDMLVVHVRGDVSAVLDEEDDEDLEESED